MASMSATGLEEHRFALHHRERRLRQTMGRPSPRTDRAVRYDCERCSGFIVYATTPRPGSHGSPSRRGAHAGGVDVCELSVGADVHLISDLDLASTVQLEGASPTRG